jgi:23S rRNA (adenine2503-C2)-methyltransferase
MDVLSMTCEALADEFGRRYGKGRHHAAAVYREFYRTGGARFDSPPESARSGRLAGLIRQDLRMELPPVAREKKEGGLIKFVTRLQDAREIETVIIPMKRHVTICLSSQAGCRMGCRFCETGRTGFGRNLSVGEIVGQAVTARILYGADIRNVVFMGMGEPFDNPENVFRAVRVLNDPRGMNISMRHMTLSTVGIPSGIDRLAAMGDARPNLAVSLNAPGDPARSRLMPVNREFPLEVLRRSLEAYPLRRGEVVFIEYVMIEGVNDSAADAEALAAFLTPLRVRVNLIPLNPTPDSPFRPPDELSVRRFSRKLAAERIFVRTRTERGGEILAACGQLGRTTA